MTISRKAYTIRTIKSINAPLSLSIMMYLLSVVFVWTIKRHIVDTSFVSFRPPQAAGVNHGAVSPLPNKTASLVLPGTPDKYAL